jgi:hypothetical protein
MPASSSSRTIGDAKRHLPAAEQQPPLVAGTSRDGLSTSISVCEEAHTTRTPYNTPQFPQTSRPRAPPRSSEPAPRPAGPSARSCCGFSTTDRTRPPTAGPVSRRPRASPADVEGSSHSAKRNRLQGNGKPHRVCDPADPNMLGSLPTKTSRCWGRMNLAGSWPTTSAGLPVDQPGSSGRWTTLGSR